MLRPVTDRVLEKVEALGSEVIDLRGNEKVLRKHRQGRAYQPLQNRLNSVEYIAVHYTGARYSQAQMRARTGNPNVTMIPEELTQKDEEGIIKFYHDFHQTRDGGIWPGIAYPFIVMPSGRLYCNWNIGLGTYHAFNANWRSVAVALPMTMLAEPSYPQLVTFFRLMDVLTTDTPEIPATHNRVYGHRELTFIDDRNITACPGPVLKHVKHYRVDGTWSIEKPKEDRGDPVQHFPETDKHLGHGFRSYWEENGGLAIFGYPITEEYDDVDLDCTAQWFERARFEHRPDIAGNRQGVVLGRIGSERQNE